VIQEKAKILRLTRGSDIHILEFNGVLSSNACKSSEISDLIFIDLTTR